MKTNTAHPESLLQAYRASDRALRLLYLRVTCVVCLLYVPSGALLDYYVYPDQLWRFVGARLGLNVFIAVLLGLLFTPWGRRHADGIGMVLPLSLQAMIAWMIACTEGASSPYYGGMNLITLGVAILLPWTALETGAFAVASLGL